MLECIFTVDYEIYGNGQGSLRELIFEPALELKRVFDAAGAPLVVFVEAAELEILEVAGADPAIGDVKAQVRGFYQQGHEIALHLHPQWYNAHRKNGSWMLDYSEYNLCLLPEERIEQIVQRGIEYLRRVVGDPAFVPASFRAGNWLFQPTATVARVLARHGLQADSSVFKGGVQHQHRLDYRPAAANGWHWRFDRDVNVADPTGPLVELPIFTEMVPFWRMLTGKRVGLQRKGRPGGGTAAPSGARSQKTNRFLDYLRWYYPMKFDFCRMTFAELTRMMQIVLREDERTPNTYKPIVSIGHTKDLVDGDTVMKFLDWLRAHGIPIATLSQARSRCE